METQTAAMILDPTGQTFLKALSDLESECGEAERLYLEAKKLTKERKEFYGSKLQELRQKVREYTAPLPLYDGTAGDPADGPPANWREIPLADMQEYGIGAKTVMSLAENNIMKLGQLADLTAKSPNADWWSSLTGIGEAKAKKVEEALEEFWQAHPEFTNAA